MALRSVEEMVDWEMVRSWRPWLLGLAGASAAVYLIYKTVRITRTDGDLTLMSKSLKPDYFTGRVVWVTGASSGIGEALCHELSKHGALLIMSARSEEKMENIKLTLPCPDNAKILPLDLSDANVCLTATEKALALFGRIDILINNAGVSQRCFFMDTDEKTHMYMMQLNFNSPRTLTRAVIPGMLAQDFGHVVNISSIWGKCGMALRGTYSPSKHAIGALTHSLHYEFYDKRNLHFTVICPGPVVTKADVNAMMGEREEKAPSDPMVQTGMTAARCAELTLVAVSNKLLEGWVSTWPYLWFPYMAHYTPGWLHSYCRRIAPAAIQKTHGRPSY